jgi:hypothetical protein
MMPVPPWCDLIRLFDIEGGAGNRIISEAADNNHLLPLFRAYQTGKEVSTSAVLRHAVIVSPAAEGSTPQSFALVPKEPPTATMRVI